MSSRQNRGSNSLQNRGGSQGGRTSPKASMTQRPDQEIDIADDGDGKPNPKSYEKTIAIWTIVLGASTIALVIATSISAWFLFTTDRTIQKQVVTARLQLRPYIGVAQINSASIIKKEPNKPDIDLGNRLVVGWKNYGATPALQASNWISAKWYPTNIEPDFSHSEGRLSQLAISNILPGAEVFSGGAFVPKDDIDKALSGNGRIFFWGHVEYQDIFFKSSIHQFHFCMIVTISQNSQTINSVYKSECNYSN